MVDISDNLISLGGNFELGRTDSLLQFPAMVLETEEEDTDRESLGRKMVEELPAAKLQEFTEIFSFFDRYFYFLRPKFVKRLNIRKHSIFYFTFS